LVNGVATVTLTNELAAGSHTIVATYLGTGDYAGGTAADFAQDIAPATVQATVAGDTTSEYGSLTTLTATMASAAGTPDGMVTFMDGSTELGSVALINGSAALDVSDLAVGDHLITAVFAANGNYAAATSADLAHTVNKATSSVTATLSNSAITAGETVTVTVTVSSALDNPTGTVAIMEGSTTLGMITLDSGTGTLDISTLAAGDHTLTAVYGGDALHATATAADATVSVAADVAPIGAVDVATTTRVSGWAYDANAGASPINVRIDIDDQAGTPFAADTTRADLQSYLGSTGHGFSFTMPTLSIGSHTVNVYLYNNPTGDAVLFRTLTVNNPNIAPIGSVDALNANVSWGWMYDANTGAGSLDMRIDVDNTQGTPFTADTVRNDLQNYLGSTHHGYGITMPAALTVGTHTVKVYVYDEPAHTPVLFRTATVVNQAPIGSFDGATGDVAYGWAVDPDLKAAALRVRVDVDGVRGTPFLAQNPRSDLTGFLGSPNHGFSYSLAGVAPGQHTVAVYLLDGTSSEARLLGTRNVTRTNHNPIGSIDVANATQIMGWAYDADLGSAAATVRIEIDGTQVGNPFTASLLRNDLTSYLGSGSHGFSFTLPNALAAGQHTVRMYITNPGGNDVAISRTFTV
jgi:hypothetical protein